MLAASIILTFTASIEIYEVIKIRQSAPIIATPSLNINKTKTSALDIPSLPILDKCEKGVALSVIAHEDDDLLFMNPDVANAIKSGKCNRTVYITAGDDGQPADYWQGRELGVKAAYASMSHRDDSWQSTKGVISGHEFEVATLNGVPSIALVFLHLPDGRISGEGFLSDRGESLRKLRTGSIQSIHAISGKTSYTSDELIQVLAAIMNFDNPDTINTQAFGPELKEGDHSDHQAVGYFTDKARHSYRGDYTFLMYLGYQAGHMPINLSPADITIKRAVFATYQQYDTSICKGLVGCRGAYTYANYMQRQYVYKTETVVN